MFWNDFHVWVIEQIKGHKFPALNKETLDKACFVFKVSSSSEMQWSIHSTPQATPTKSEWAFSQFTSYFLIHFHNSGENIGL